MDKKNKGLLTEVQEWVKDPISGDMDIWDVILTTVLVASVAFLWTRVLAQIVD